MPPRASLRSAHLGQPAFVAARSLQYATKACDSMEMLDAPPLASQDSWLLLQGSLQLRVVHHPRLGKWEEVGRVEETVEDSAVHSVFAIIDREWSHAASQQLTLPRHGVFRICGTCQQQGHAAYLSAAAMTQRVMHAGPAAFRPFEGPIGAVLRPEWEALHDVAVGLWEPDQRLVDVASMITISRAQSTFNKRVDDLRHESVQATFDATTAEGQQGLARPRSCACSVSAAWLTALPMHGSLPSPRMAHCPTAGLEARGDILMALESGLPIVSLSVTHPPGVANRSVPIAG
jgi:hypothetical protein